MAGALEGDVVKRQSNEESSSRAIEKQVRATLEAKIAYLLKDMKIEVQLGSEKEAAEHNLTPSKDKLGEAKRIVSEVQMNKAATKCSRPFDTQLLQNIPNEITLGLICTKLPWRAIRSLSSVNRCWREAIQSRRVYDARLHAQATETLVCVTRTPRYEMPDQVSTMDEINDMGFEAMIGLYSLIEDSCSILPQIPNLDTRSKHLGAGGLPACSQCVSLDGKIYILGGTDNPNFDDWDWERHGRCGSSEVYVLDVAGQRPWKQVASMQESRMDFAACVKDGRIYVFGGRSLGKPVHCSEVYDPEVDEWSPIMPMTSFRYRHKVAVRGEELVVFGGECYDRVNQRNPLYARDFEVYHLAKNEWRVARIDDFVHYNTLMFAAKGKPYLFDSHAIYSVGDDDHGSSSWMNGLENSFPDIVLPAECSVWPCVAVSVNDEVLAILQFISQSHGKLHDRGTFLLQSIGFNREDNKTGPGEAVKSLKWQKLNCSLPLEGMLESGAMFDIQL